MWECLAGRLVRGIYSSSTFIALAISDSSTLRNKPRMLGKIAASRFNIELTNSGMVKDTINNFFGLWPILLGIQIPNRCLAQERK